MRDDADLNTPKGRWRFTGDSEYIVAALHAFAGARFELSNYAAPVVFEEVVAPLVEGCQVLISEREFEEDTAQVPDGLPHA